jgi:hypothetical protein
VRQVTDETIGTGWALTCRHLGGHGVTRFKSTRYLCSHNAMTDKVHWQLPQRQQDHHREHLKLELEFLRPTASRPVRLDMGPPFGTLALLSSSDNYFILLSKAPSLTRKRCSHSPVRLLAPNNHTLPSHLRLCSLSVAYYDSQGLRWKYSIPPPHGVAPQETARTHLKGNITSQTEAVWELHKWEVLPVVHILLSQ